MIHAATALRTAPPKPVTVPLWVIRLVALYLYEMVTSSMHPSNASASRELGWAPAYPTYRDGIRAMAPRR